MKIPMLDLKRQYAEIQNELEPAVLEALQSGSYIMGPAVAALETELAAYLGVRFAVAVASGTDALVLALRALGIGPGDEVITTPFTFFATAEAVAQTGATPVFADVCEDGYNLDPESVRGRITARTKAILPVHIFGRPANMAALCALAGRHGLRVIEDACQAIGAQAGGKMLGSIGDAGCFSFFPTKNLGAFGDGGLVTTNDENTAILLRALREHAGGKNGAAARAILDGQAPSAVLGEADPMYNPYKYFNYFLAYNSRLDAVQAVILRIKLRHLDRWNDIRRENAAFYRAQIQNPLVTLPDEGPGEKAVWHQFALRTPHKEALGEYLAAKGIASGAFYPVPLHLQKAFESLGYREGDLPVAEMLVRQTVSLPVFPGLTQDELAFIADAVNAFRG